MKMRFVVVCAVLLATASAILAQSTVILKDGSRIRGTVTREGGKVVIKNSLLGTIRAPEESVRAVTDAEDGIGKAMPDQDIIMNEIVRFVPASLKKEGSLKSPVIAVKKVMVSGKYTVSDKVLETKLIDQIVKETGFRVVERQALKALLEEQKLSLTGLAEYDESKVGKLIGVDAFMDVSVNTPNHYSMESDMRITETETGRQVWQDNFSGFYSGDLKIAVGLTWQPPYAYSFSGEIAGPGTTQYNISTETGQNFGLTVRMGQRLSFTRLLELGLNLSFLEQDFMMNQGADRQVYPEGKVTAGGIKLAHPNMSFSMTLKLHPSELFNSSWDVLQPYAGVGLTEGRIAISFEDSYEEELFKDYQSTAVIAGLEVRFSHYLSLFGEYTHLTIGGVVSDDMDGAVTFDRDRIRAGLLYYIVK